MKLFIITPLNFFILDYFRLFITKQNDDIILHEAYYTDLRGTRETNETLIHEYCYFISKKSLNILAIKMECADIWFGFTDKDD